MLEIYVTLAGQGSDSLAPPTQVAKTFALALVDGALWEPTRFTLGAAATGLLLASLLGIVLGIVIGLSRRASTMSRLSVEVLRPVPPVALIPLSMLVFGFGLSMEISIVAFAAFWPMLILTQSAVQQVEPRLLEVSRVLELSPIARCFKVILPAIVPRLFVAFRLGVAVALVVAVTVEIAGNPHGMGYAMIVAQHSLQPELMLAWLLWIALIGYLINQGALKLQRFIGRRMGEVE
ncbi:MAG TPA: ABC transporter permease subunit [Rubrivivax sp.]|nr:ABC transporter permease subunit [Rubrivivax sp.]